MPTLGARAIPYAHPMRPNRGAAQRRQSVVIIATHTPPAAGTHGCSCRLLFVVQDVDKHYISLRFDLTVVQHTLPHHLHRTPSSLNNFYPYKNEVHRDRRRPCRLCGRTCTDDAGPPVCARVRYPGCVRRRLRPVRARIRACVWIVRRLTSWLNGTGRT